jgi:hypothetical protein
MTAMDTTALLLEPGQALTLPPGPAGRRLRVLQGRIWLTISGDVEDYVVAAGQEQVLPGSRTGDIVVQAERGQPAVGALLRAPCSGPAPRRTLLGALR